MHHKKAMFILPCMKGGGAERVAALLANEFHHMGIETSFLLTSCTPEEVVRIDLEESVPLNLLSEIPIKEHWFKRLFRKMIRICSSVVCRVYEKLEKAVPAYWAYLSFWSQYRNEIQKLRSIMASDPNLCVISFLQPSIPMTVLAARGLSNRVLISERGDPCRLMKKRYGWNFIKKYYKRVDAAVFQTCDAQDTYPECISKKGTVIPNPIKVDLPKPYYGRRNRNITTFCRISAQKNLQLLLEAFALLHGEHPDYILRIIGDSLNTEGDAIKKQLDAYIAEHQLDAAVQFEPFNADIHKDIIRDAMYVNSSDYEGISNAMLEAMAIGMPVVCTDCPIGGANQTIVDGVNGLLVPVNDIQAMYKAMKRVVEEPDLASRLSINAAKLREELALSKIARKWMELLEDGADLSD